MSSITDFLNLISGARYGREVRQAIVDAISQCYEDGRAGVNDLEARRLIEAVIAVNEGQEVEISDLRMQIEEIIGGGPSTETVGTTTTEVPTFIHESGVASITVPSRTSKTVHVTFTAPFTEPPVILVSNGKATGADEAYANVTANILHNSITEAGFDFFVANNTSKTRSPMVTWLALQPTTVEINTEIVVPATDDLTQEQIDSLIGLLE